MKRKSERRDIKFWKGWLKANSLERPKLIQQLPIVQKRFRDLEDKKLGDETFAIILEKGGCPKNET